MPEGPALEPAATVARKNLARQPNESREYRQARESLLAEKIDSTATSRAWRPRAAPSRPG